MCVLGGVCIIMCVRWRVCVWGGGYVCGVCMCMWGYLGYVCKEVC